MTTDFVCVRMVKMNGVDLGQFQFDYDLTWSAFFLHADGTVYARYGSRTVEGAMVSNSREGLLLTMKRVLEVHKKFPANRHLFEGKRGSEPEFRRPEEIPSPRVRSGGGQINRGNCIHCHNVHEALHDVELKGGSRLPRRIFKYPLPENIGLVIKKGSGNRVLRVLQNSPSAMAGIEAGTRWTR